MKCALFLNRSGVGGWFLAGSPDVHYGDVGTLA